MNKPHLLVPIHLDALVITKDLYVLGRMADFSRMKPFGIRWATKTMKKRCLIVDISLNKFVGRLNQKLW